MGETTTAAPRTGTFRSLRIFNYRVWAAGAVVSNIGTWMQRTAQDWLVLAQLTKHDARALSIVVSLQFAPQVLLLPLTGLAADHFDRRKLIIATQAVMGALALLLGLLTISGRVQLWQVYVFAFLLGCVTAFDAPARQTFVSELVGETDLSNAVGLNATSFNAARMVGPAIAGVLIGAVGSGWLFILNAASFACVLGSLSFLRAGELHRHDRPERTRASFAEGFRYLWSRPDLRAVLLMLFFLGIFGLNFPFFISTMSVIVFHVGAEKFGVLTSMMAVGSVTGALLAARREKPSIGVLVSGAFVFAIGFALATVMPTYWLFAATLVLIGVAAQTFTNTSLALMQLSTDKALRGRVMAIVLAVALGGVALGSPVLGWVAKSFGPRWALGLTALTGLIAVSIGLAQLTKAGRVVTAHEPIGDAR